MQDIAHLRDKVNELFDGVFHIREMRNNNVEVKYEQIGQSTDDLDLGDSQYTDGRQYKVECVSEIEIDDLMQSSFEVELETVDLPYGETIYTSMHLHRTKYQDEEGIYGLTDGLNTDYQDYQFTSNNFSVWNAGNVDIEPERMDIKITVNNLYTSGNFTIRNKTNGDTFVLRKSAKGTLVLDSITVYLNSLNTLRNTNYQFVGLAKGLNNFEILNGSFDSITFDFRFYYK